MTTIRPQGSLITYKHDRGKSLTPGMTIIRTENNTASFSSLEQHHLFKAAIPLIQKKSFAEDPSSIPVLKHS